MIEPQYCENLGPGSYGRRLQHKPTKSYRYANRPTRFSVVDPNPNPVAKGHTIVMHLDGSWEVRDGAGRFVRLFKGRDAAALASRCALQHDRAR